MTSFKRIQTRMCENKRANISIFLHSSASDALEIAKDCLSKDMIISNPADWKHQFQNKEGLMIRYKTSRGKLSYFSSKARRKTADKAGNQIKSSTKYEKSWIIVPPS
jgi:hypothetical protein